MVMNYHRDQTVYFKHYIIEQVAYFRQTLSVYLCMCVSVYALNAKKHKKMGNNHKTRSYKNCSYLFLCVYVYMLKKSQPKAVSIGTILLHKNIKTYLSRSKKISLEVWLA
jgi:hypothetical protein